jgi:hypothetical protein
MADNAQSGIISHADSIKSSAFSIQVQLLTRKEHQISWTLVPEAKAVDCFPRYDFLDTITVIKLKRFNTDSTIVDVTQQFSGNIYYPNNGNEQVYSLENLTHYINSWLFGNGDQISIFPTEGQVITGEMRFILEFTLSDQRVLRDTTRLVNLIP